MLLPVLNKSLFISHSDGLIQSRNNYLVLIIFSHISAIESTCKVLEKAHTTINKNNNNLCNKYVQDSCIAIFSYACVCV